MKYHVCFVFLQCLGVHRSSLEPLQRQKRAWIIDSLEIDEGYEGTFPYSLGKVSTCEQSQCVDVRKNISSCRSIIYIYIFKLLLLHFDSLQVKIAEQLRLFSLRGQGIELDPKGVLNIDPDTGEIFVLRPVDYEEYSILKVRGKFPARA